MCECLGSQLAMKVCVRIFTLHPFLCNIETLAEGQHVAHTQKYFKLILFIMFSSETHTFPHSQQSNTPLCVLSSSVSGVISLAAARLIRYNEVLIYTNVLTNQARVFPREYTIKEMEREVESVREREVER